MKDQASGAARRSRRPLVAAALLIALALMACDGGHEPGAGAALVAAGVSAPVEPTPTGGEEGTASPAHPEHGPHAEPLAAAPLPGTSLFHLGGAFTDSAGEEFRLPELRGRPSVIVMFYGDCTTACPLLVRSAQEIEAALTPAASAQAQFVMVSFDTERDTPDRLAAYAAERGLDKEGWHWLVGSPLLTRQFAALLGVQYRDAGGGAFAHSNLVTVLDADGVPAARLEGLGVGLEPAIAALEAAVSAAGGAR